MLRGPPERTMPFDTIIRGGTIVTATDTFEADVAITGAVIAAIGHDLGEAQIGRAHV